MTDDYFVISGPYARKGANVIRIGWASWSVFDASFGMGASITAGTLEPLKDDKGKKKGARPWSE